MDVTLVAKFQNKLNILKILENGSRLGFIYYDQIMGKKYENSPILTPNQALEKIINSIELDLEGGPTVYTRINEQSCAFLSFYDNEELVKCSIFGMTNVVRKEFEEDCYEIDFAFYIKIILDLCENFAIKSIEIGEY